MISSIYLVSILCFFGKSYQEAAYYSPYIDHVVDETQFGCGTPPDVCPVTKYRSFDGSCNNLNHPEWGMSQLPYQRLIKSNYEDGIYMPALAKSGNRLTDARTISLTMYPDNPNQLDPKYTIAGLEYGQLITHDLSQLIFINADKVCCANDNQLQFDPGNNPIDCMPIIFTFDVDGNSTTRCIAFNRTVSTWLRECTTANETSNPLSRVTGHMDLSNIYGSTVTDNGFVRNYTGGRLKIAVREGHAWQSEPSASQASFMCFGQSATDPCYIGGDNNANQSPSVVMIQIIMFREHNRLVDGLASLNPHWDDETLFQEARRILIALHQHIAYYEYLPIRFGKHIPRKHKLIYDTTEYVNDYSNDTNPTPSVEHATAGFRYFHAGVSGKLELADEDRNKCGYHNLSDHYNGQYFLEENNNFDNLIRGFTSQPHQLLRTYHTKEITERFFKSRFSAGDDLKALDIQRSRDHGLPSYNDMRQFCGYPRAKTFDDFSDIIKNKNYIEKLMAMYECPDDVDFTVGGSLEDHVPETMVGPTFLKVTIDQFQRTRKGDRFWFEHNEKQNGFTRGQLKEIRKVKMSRLLCDHGNNITRMQMSGFEQISKLNPLIACNKIPSLNLSLWKEY